MGMASRPALHPTRTANLAACRFPEAKESTMQRPRHFSMLREFQLADWFTLANAFCGTGAVFAALRFLQEGVVRDLMIGMALITMAFILYSPAGRISAWRQESGTA